jgi:uncharacterized protein (DUF2249 family)
MTERVRTRLDVRPVEPKDRFETIMGAYEALPPQGVLHLTVDHDPRCMYYTLQATKEEPFDFHYVEEGPERWVVEVTRGARVSAGEEARV